MLNGFDGAQVEPVGNLKENCDPGNEPKTKSRFDDDNPPPCLMKYQLRTLKRASRDRCLILMETQFWNQV